MSKPDQLRPHDTIRSQLRIPAELHERLRAACNATGRSMNAEIVQRLEESFEQRDAPATINDAQLLRTAFDLLRTVKEQGDAVEREIAKAKNGDESAIDWAGSIEMAQAVLDSFRDEASKARQGIGVITRMLSEKKPIPDEWRLWYLENGIKLR